MSRSVMSSIDSTAYKFYTTKDKKYFDEFVKYASPVIQRMVHKACAGSMWDVDELFSILLADMWRLFNSWQPVKDKKFHWLMLRQLKNKTINYVHQMQGKPRRICNVCGTHQEKGAVKCSKCGASLKFANIIVSNTFELLHNSCNPNYLKDVADKQLVAKLLAQVKDTDPKTYEILRLMLEGRSKNEISSKVNLAQHAMNNRIKKCRKIINNLMEEKKYYE